MLAHVTARSADPLSTRAMQTILAACVKAGTAPPLMLVTSAGWESSKVYLVSFCLPLSFGL